MLVWLHSASTVRNGQERNLRTRYDATDERRRSRLIPEKERLRRQYGLIAASAAPNGQEGTLLARSDLNNESLSKSSRHTDMERLHERQFGSVALSTAPNGREKQNFRARSDLVSVENQAAWIQPDPGQMVVEPQASPPAPEHIQSQPVFRTPSMVRIGQTCPTSLLPMVFNNRALSQFHPPQLGQARLPRSPAPIIVVPGGNGPMQLPVQRPFINVAPTSDLLRDTSWQDRFWLEKQEELRKHYCLTGNCHSFSSNPDLRDWVKGQRHQYNLLREGKKSL